MAQSGAFVIVICVHGIVILQVKIIFQQLVTKLPIADELFTLLDFYRVVDFNFFLNLEAVIHL